MKRAFALVALFAALTPSIAARAQGPTAATQNKPAGSEARARTTEEDAFAAVDARRFCDAAALFLQADGEAPNPVLVYNAARAADFAQDRALALDLYTRVTGSTAPEAQRAESLARAQSLRDLIAREGPGTACGAPATTSAPAAAPLAHDASGSASDASSSPSSSPSSPSSPSSEAATLDHGAPVWTYLVAGAGGATLAGGVIVTAVGAVPWFTYASAQRELRALESAGSRDTPSASSAYAKQRDAETAWTRYGRASVAMGIALMATGAGVAVAGLVASFLVEGE